MADEERNDNQRLLDKLITVLLRLVMLNHATNPCKFESFLNVAQEDQARVLLFVDTTYKTAFP